MIRKLIAIVFAVLINCAVFAYFHAWSTDAVASAMPPQPANKVLRVLPAMTVRPTRAQLEMLRHEARPARATPQGQGAT